MPGEQSFAKLGASRAELEGAAGDRLKDSEALFKARRYASAIAMGLYAQEIELKVTICKRLDIDSLPTAFQTHEFAGLLVLTGLKRRMDDPAALRIKANWESVTLNKDFEHNKLRYSPTSRWSRSQALEFLGRLRAAPDGVIPWIRAQI